MKSSNIGGQAVLEGIMMKNGNSYAVAVRKPDGEIEVKKERVQEGRFAKAKKIPFVRGVFQFVDSLVLGMKTLTYSASFWEEEEGEELRVEDAKKQEKKDSFFMTVTVCISILLAVGIFMVLPNLIATGIGYFVKSKLLEAVIEGLSRIAIFVCYILLVSLMKDIRRTFMYHGAEHKCINCIESGHALTVENVRASSKEHKRCGTSFLFYVMFVSIILFFFLNLESKVLEILLRIVLVPVIAGISYEIIKLAGSSNNVIVNIISKPGLWLQKLTTKEPEDDMIEVGIKAVEEVFDWKTYLTENFGVTFEAEKNEPS